MRRVTRSSEVDWTAVTQYHGMRILPVKVGRMIGESVSVELKDAAYAVLSRLAVQSPPVMPVLFSVLQRRTRRAGTLDQDRCFHFRLR